MLPDRMSELLSDLEDPQECLRRAKACEEIANRQQHPNRRSLLLELAEHWRELASELQAIPPKSATS